MSDFSVQRDWTAKCRLSSFKSVIFLSFFFALGDLSAASMAHHEAVRVQVVQFSGQQSEQHAATQQQGYNAYEKTSASDAENAAKATREREQDRNDKFRSDVLAAIIGFGTLGVLLAQTFVFGQQARRLRETIEAMRAIDAAQGQRMENSLRLAEMAASASADSADLTRQALMLAQRPRIRVGNFWVGNTEFERPNLGNLRTIAGQFDYENIGGTAASVLDADIMIISNESGLPFRYPIGTRRNPRANRVNRQPVIAPSDLAPGETDSGVFSGEGYHHFQGEQGQALAVGRPGVYLFIIGWIEYSDRLMIVRRTRFARQYDHATGRFLPVSDPDYEYEA